MLRVIQTFIFSCLISSLAHSQGMVQWTNLLNCVDANNTLTKISGDGWAGAATAGANSTAQLPPHTDGFVYTVVQETNKYRMFGLAAPNSGAHFSTIDYAINLNGFGILNVYFSGSSQGNFGSFATGDTLIVERVGNQIEFLHNGNVFFSVACNPADPLIADASFFHQGSTLYNTYASFSSSGGGGTGDNLGNHTATQNVLGNGNWYSGDGDDEGLFVDPTGKVGVGSFNPTQQLDVHGGYVLSADFSGEGRFYGGREGDDYIAISTDLVSSDYISLVSDFEILRATDQKVGIGTTTPAARLHTHEGSVLFDGAAGDVPASGAGQRFFYASAKAALRAGLVTGNHWNEDSVGFHSIAMGSDVSASGNGSVSIGTNGTSRGLQSVSIGTANVSEGLATTAIGTNSRAKGAESLTLGKGNESWGDESVAIGNSAHTFGNNSMAIGHFVKTNALNAMAIGSGIPDSLSFMVNNIPNSLGIGFNSTIPTMHVTPANGAGATGSVGINNSNPTHKLHVRGADDNNNVLRLDGTGVNSSQARLDFGNPGFAFIEEDFDDALHIFSATRTSFTGGNVGIHTANPMANLQVGDTTGINDLAIFSGGAGATSSLFLMERESGRDQGFEFRYVADEDRLDLVSLVPPSPIDALSVHPGGEVTIGTKTVPNGYLFGVGGKMIAVEMKVQLETNWPDYVFDEDYDLMPIEMLEKSVFEHKRLPGIPPASQVESEGLSLGDMQVKMMEKIEELTLYIIDLKKENNSLKERMNAYEEQK